MFYHMHSDAQLLYVSHTLWSTTVRTSMNSISSSRDFKCTYSSVPFCSFTIYVSTYDTEQKNIGIRRRISYICTVRIDTHTSKWCMVLWNSRQTEGRRPQRQYVHIRASGAWYFKTAVRQREEGNRDNMCMYTKLFKSTLWQGTHNSCMSYDTSSLKVSSCSNWVTSLCANSPVSRHSWSQYVSIYAISRRISTSVCTSVVQYVSMSVCTSVYSQSQRSSSSKDDNKIWNIDDDSHSYSSI
jgi:hypothetical protein